MREELAMVPLLAGARSDGRAPLSSRPCPGLPQGLQASASACMAQGLCHYSLSRCRTGHSAPAQ